MNQKKKLQFKIRVKEKSLSWQKDYKVDAYTSGPLNDLENVPKYISKIENFPKKGLHKAV